MPIIDVWGVLSDPDVPQDVADRLLARQEARRRGLTPDVVPEADKSFLARHVVVRCVHKALIRPHGDGWAHLSDHAPCQPCADAGVRPL